MGAQEGNHHCLEMLLCRAVCVFAPWAYSMIFRTAISRSKSEFVLFAMRSFEHFCGVLKFGQVRNPEGRYPPLHKSASRSALGVDMESLKDSMNGATKFAGRHLQDVSWVGMDNIIIGPVVIIV